jgi:transposase
MKEQKRGDNITIGLDLGDRRHRFCVLGGVGEVVEEGSLVNDRAQLSALIARYPAAVVVMEAGGHSPWVSRYLKQLGGEVIVANPRKVRAIYQHERKSDRRDALMLARIGPDGTGIALPGGARKRGVAAGFSAHQAAR